MTTDSENGVLNAEQVSDIYMHCILRRNKEDVQGITAEGVMQTVTFHPGRIETHQQLVHDMLAELPDAFKTSGGGGASFLDACFDRHERQWTELHRTVEQLIQLGIAIGEVEFCLPRELWGVFPDGMPYFTVKQ